jgi:hypothetical protein
LQISQNERRDETRKLKLKRFNLFKKQGKRSCMGGWGLKQKREKAGIPSLPAGLRRYFFFLASFG